MFHKWIASLFQLPNWDHHHRASLLCSALLIPLAFAQTQVFTPSFFLNIDALLPVNKVGDQDRSFSTLNGFYFTEKEYMLREVGYLCHLVVKWN